MIVWMLVLVSGSTLSATYAGDFDSLAACQSAGEIWAKSSVYNARYQCILVDRGGRR